MKKRQYGLTNKRNFTDQISSRTALEENLRAISIQVESVIPPPTSKGTGGSQGEKKAFRSRYWIPPSRRSFLPLSQFVAAHKDDPSMEASVVLLDSRE